MSEDYGRAGRNLRAAIPVGLGLLLLIGLSLRLAPWTLSIIVAVASALAVHELKGALARKDLHVGISLYVGAPLMVIAAYFGGEYALVVTFGLTVLVALLERLGAGADGYIRDAGASTFVAAYVPFLLSFAMLLLRSDNGTVLVLILVLLSAGTDTGGYIAGVLFGRHPMAPSISPKKSWEGFAGSIVLNAVLGSFLFMQLLDQPWTYGAIAGALLALVGTQGDLVESLIKRDAGLKDMSNLLPGHGGIMDRLDSVIPNAFAAWALFAVLLGT